ncbi:putative Proton-coupled folate transporter [Hypsibius exemplaris]|uniref:Proton-coupled folate transporter n=1 Tax=Hypsibius exemplaris TaxID=2072580 RepID=A0A9X6NGW8_HYPEX|nr:putative Proton-coupled folate transporter [Hypsibius exemplaris]
MKLFGVLIEKPNVRTLRIVLLEPVILFYMMGIWMQFSLFQPLLFEKICSRTLGSDDNSCQNSTRLNATTRKGIQEETSRLLFWSNLCLTIPSICLAPFLGYWGDTFGRKFPVLLPSLGALLSAINYAVCAAIPGTPAELLLLSNLFQGLTGGFTGVILAVSSWAATLTSIRIRTSRLGLIEFANLFGTAIAPAVGGAVAKQWGSPYAFGVAGLLTVLQIAYVMFFLRVEKPHPGSSHSSGYSGASTLIPLRELFGFIRTKWTDLNARFMISMAALCLTVTWLVSTGTTEIRYLFVESLNLNWDILEYNLFAAEDAGIRGLTLVTILPFLKHYWHMKDFPIMLCAFSSKIVMFALWAASKTSALIFIAPVTGFLAAAVSACGRSAASKFVQKTDQGKLFSLLAILENLSSLIGSLVFQNVYVATRVWFSGFPFVLADIFLLVPVAFLLLYMPILRSTEASNTVDRQQLLDEAVLDTDSARDIPKR